jgi:phage tail sheath protein FI
MTSPTFGLEFIKVNDQPQPVVGANMDVIGLVGPCSTADVDRFPLNTPVLVYSNDTTLGRDLGSDGYLRDAIEAINTQLADFEVAAQIVIVRTPYGTSGDSALRLQQTIARIMGQSTVGSGIWALLKAPNTLFCTPRIIVCPGYTGQMATSLDTIDIDDIGIGYIPGQEYTITFEPGNAETNGANLVLPTAHAIADSQGYIRQTDIFIDSYGAWMTDEPIATLPAHDGDPITALQASGSIIFSQQPGVGATITLNGSAVSFVSSGASGLQVNIGVNLAATIDNLVTVLNESSDTEVSKCTYATFGGTVTITDDTAGVAGNDYTLATTVAGASVSNTTLTGGRDADASQTATLTTTIALGANPVVAELTPVLNQLIAHAIVESAGTSQVNDEQWRSTMNSQRLIPLSGGIKVIDPDSGAVIVRPLAPRVAGILVARDHSTGYPFHSAANQPIQGVVAPARTIGFSLTDGATEGQVLLAANLGIVVRGLVGVETAISSGGFIFIGTDNAGDDELWRMYNVTRGRDYIHLSLMPALRTYLGRTNITKHTVISILTTISDFLGTLKARENIIDFRVKFDGSLNTADQIRLGRLTVGFQAEEPPVLKRITTMSARYRPAIDAMVSQLEQQLNVAA